MPRSEHTMDKHKRIERTRQRPEQQTPGNDEHGNYNLVDEVLSRRSHIFTRITNHYPNNSLRTTVSSRNSWPSRTIAEKHAEQKEDSRPNTPTRESTGAKTGDKRTRNVGHSEDKVSKKKRHTSSSDRDTFDPQFHVFQNIYFGTVPDEDASFLEEFFTGSKMTLRRSLRDDKVYTMERTGEICLFSGDVLYVISPNYATFTSQPQNKMPVMDCQFYDYYGILKYLPDTGKNRELPKGQAKLKYTDEDQTSSPSSCGSDVHVDESRRPSVDIEEFIRLIECADDC